MPQDDDALADFERSRARLFGVAYRMLGSVADAEDVVQDTWLRWQQTDRSVVREPTAFLTTTATRLAITAATTAHRRRTSYVGPWLPEPVDTSADPELGALRKEAIEIAVLILLEQLAPTERAAYVLREAFSYPYREIGRVLSTSDANARQLVNRARRHLGRDRRRAVSRAEQDRLVRAFLMAAQQGETPTLESMLVEDAVSVSDGGGVVRAARIPVAGRVRAAQFVVTVMTKFGQDVSIRYGEANGGAAAYFSRAGAPIAVMTLEITDRGIEQIFTVMNPEKLRALPG